MEIEKKEGPGSILASIAREKEGRKPSRDDEEEEEESHEKEEEKLDEDVVREYEKSKLRYYFAVAVFDSKETANRVYKEVDGLEVRN